MLTNIYIENLMKNIHGFLGVFSSNNSPMLKNHGECIIINFDKNYERGSHFIAIFINKDNTCLYFDSLNNVYIPEDIHHYLKKYKRFKNMSQMIQSPFSTYCGFYCMLFLVCYKIGKKCWELTLSKFILKSDDLKNDKICITMLCKYIKMYYRKNKKLKM